jgi:hypothetical protein
VTGRNRIQNIDTQLESSTDETLGIKYCIAGVHGSLIFGGITNQTLFSGESNVGWRRPVSL